MTVRYGAQTPMRRDAARNRAAILAAASEAMTTPRTTIGIPEIARRAGVGQATLYRHFPDRLALASAVITYQMERLEACVANTVRQPARFRQVLGELLRTQVTMRPLVLLARRLDPGVRDRFVRRMITALSAPLRSAQDQGYVRRDLAPGDLMLLVSMVEGVVADDPAAAEKSIRIALDGICLDAGGSDRGREAGRAEGAAVVGHHR
jgi:AcrR family transcriptional regulator